MGQTIFSKIIAGDIPAEKIHEDSEVIAIRDINPQAPVHVLIIPKEEIPTIDDLRREHQSLLGHMLLVAADIARREGIAEDGYRLVFNCRPHGGQEVYHIHLHLIGGKQLGKMV